MMVTLAGAMSTARIGRILGRLIREGKVHAITCTGANLEEDVFNLLAANDYRDHRGLARRSAPRTRRSSTTRASTASPTRASPRRSCATSRSA
jgi:hypothetical protein